MALHVGFLRAVNLGSRRAPAATLVDAVEALGFGPVWTYANSGNVVFDASGGREALERRLEDAFERALGFEATTFVRAARELRTALDANPFDVAPGDTYFVTFLKNEPAAAARSGLEALSNDFDTIVVVGRDVHWRMHGKSSDSKLRTKQWDDLVGRHRSTSRNVTLLRRLSERIDAQKRQR
jgi:uncharacterized protein (DUF1697 family)